MTGRSEGVAWRCSFWEKRENQLKKKILIRVALLLSCCAALLALPVTHAHAQSCAMCYQSAAASGPQGGAALRHGILILFIPAISLFVGIFALIYHRRDVAR
jgi:hypothetical protein